MAFNATSPGLTARQRDSRCCLQIDALIGMQYAPSARWIVDRRWSRCVARGRAFRRRRTHTRCSFEDSHWPSDVFEQNASPVIDEDNRIANDHENDRQSRLGIALSSIIHQLAFVASHHVRMEPSAFTAPYARKERKSIDRGAKY